MCIENLLLIIKFKMYMMSDNWNTWCALLANEPMNKPVKYKIDSSIIYILFISILWLDVYNYQCSSHWFRR